MWQCICEYGFDDLMVNQIGVKRNQRGNIVTGTYAQIRTIARLRRIEWQKVNPKLPIYVERHKGYTLYKVKGRYGFDFELLEISLSPQMPDHLVINLPYWRFEFTSFARLFGQDIVIFTKYDLHTGISKPNCAMRLSKWITFRPNYE